VGHFTAVSRLYRKSSTCQQTEKENLPLFSRQEREKLAAVSRLAEVFPLASQKHERRRVSVDCSSKGNDHVVAGGLLSQCLLTEALAMHETLDIFVFYSDC
jgi:hypothetical protein